MTEANQTKQAKLRPREGTVVSAAGNKTIQVEVQNLVKHPMYGKYIRRRTKLAVHDPENAAGVGDTVEVVACRRLSKNKNHRLTRVVRTAALPEKAGR
ncbi:MAG: 30S ribosomal protein S17 [Planctomycetota bacterium]